VAPLRALKPTRDTVDVIPYAPIGEVHADTLEPVPVREWGTLLQGLDDDIIAGILDAFGAGTGPGLVEIRLLGGAIAREPALPSAMGHRQAAFSVLCAMFALPGESDRITATLGGLEGALARHDMHAAFPNFLSSGNADPDHVRRAYEPNDYAMLAAIKHAWDPEKPVPAQPQYPARPSGVRKDHIQDPANRQGARRAGMVQQVSPRCSKKGRR